MAPSNAVDVETPLRVLFVGGGRSGRAQMAAALLRQAGGSRFDVHIAAREPSELLASSAIAALGLDPVANSTGACSHTAWDYVISLSADAGARGSDETKPSSRMALQWRFPNPAVIDTSEAERYAGYIAVRDAIAGRVRAFVRDESPARVS